MENEHQFLALSARSRVVISITLSWMCHSFNINKNMLKLINKSKGGIFGGKTWKKWSSCFKFMFYFFSVNWLHLSNAVLLISYRLHYSLWNKNNSDWRNMWILENWPNTLKRRNCSNLSALQRNFLVLLASKSINVRGMNNGWSITNRAVFLNFQADWK